MSSGDEPRIWVGCMNCYNSGRLVGEWFEAEDNGNIDVVVVHELGKSEMTDYCEEIWVYDHENIPVKGEISVRGAEEWFDRYESLEDTDDWPAYCAWVDADNSDGDIEKFIEAYEGEFDDFDEYIQSDDSFQAGWPELAVQYFDWDQYGYEMGLDMTTVSSGSGVYVFNNAV